MKCKGVFVYILALFLTLWIITTIVAKIQQEQGDCYELCRY